MIKGSIQKEDNKIVNIYAPNIGAPQYLRQMLRAIKEEVYSNTIIVGEFNISFTPMDRSSRQKINMETQALNNTIDQIDLIDIYRTFHSKRADYTFFSSAHRIFSKIDHILGHKSSLGKFKETKIISSIFCNHDTMRLEINYRKNNKNKNIWRLNNMVLNNQEITEEIIKYLETNDNKNMMIQNMGFSKNSSKREVYRNTILPQETRKISTKLSNRTTKGTRERRTNKTQS